MSMSKGKFGVAIRATARDGVFGILGLALAAWLGSAPTHAQSDWVTFTDETATRLQVEPFADATGGTYQADTQEKDIVIADLNQDGFDDAIVVRKEPFSNSGARQDVLLMSEAGVLVDRTATLAPGFIDNPSDARDVFVGDFTGDGWDDVVIANTFGQQPHFYRNAGLDEQQQWLGLVDESSTRLPFLDIPVDVNTVQFCAVWGGDVTGDGALDIYLSNYHPTVATTDILLINDGTGQFVNETASRLGDYAAVSFGSGAEIVDIDHDGDNDIIKITTLYSAPPFNVGQYVLFNDGNGVFNTFPFLELPTDDPYMFATGDLNSDGKLDIFMEGDNQDRVLLANTIIPDQSITYDVTELVNSPRTASFGGNTKLVDIDNDGDLDVGIGPIDVDIENCGNSSEFTLMRNDGAGAMEDPFAQSENFHLDPHDFGFLDVNGDSCMDMLMALCTGWRVFIQSCEPVVQYVAASAFMVRTGRGGDGGLAELLEADDQYAYVESTLNANQTAQATSTFIGAFSPTGDISQFNLAVELSSDDTDNNIQVELIVRSFAEPGWHTLALGTLSSTDQVLSVRVLNHASSYLRSDGLLLMRLQTSRDASTRDSDYNVKIDHVQLEITR